MVIKCHSGFVHYNMFHNGCGCGGGNNYGSIFNITNNCGGGHTSFWGGLGAGLGFGFGGMLGGLFSNFMGGFGNMFGGFGMGNMFGMGGFGGWGNGMSGLWGLGGSADRGGKADDDYSDYSSRRPRRSSRREDDDAAKKDIDNPKFASITAEIKTLQPGQVSQADYDRIKKALKDALESTDSIQTEKDKETYNNLLGILDNLKNSKPASAADDDGKRSVADDDGTGKINGKPIDELAGDDIEGITEDQFNKLSDDDKAKLTAKIKGLPEADRVNLAKNTSIPSALRIAAKQSFYENGYTNVGLDSLSDEEIAKLKSVIDESGNVINFENIKSVSDIQRADDGKLKSFKMTAQSGTQVPYERVDVIDGELIFHGKQENQKYVLQKDTEGNYHLMQYAYHDGFGTPDVTSRR